MKLIQVLCIGIIMLVASNKPLHAASIASADSLKTVQLKVKGITCSTDLKMICTSIEKVKGVISCKVAKQGTTTTFEVSFQPAMVSEKEITAAIENTGSCENPDERPYQVKP